MYLFLDVETTGLPQSWKAPVSQVNNWPRIVEIAWIQADEKGNEIVSGTTILKPDGFTIPEDASSIHKVTTKIAYEKGKDRVEVLEEFADLLKQSSVLVAHNIDFDQKVVHSEFIRYNIKSNIHEIDTLCTKELTTDYCKIPGHYGYKWPTLAELYEKVFLSTLENAHSALVDAQACKDCFFELVSRDVIKLIGSKVIVNALLDDDELVLVDDIEEEFTYNGDLQYFTRVRHLGLKEHKFLKAYDEWVLEEKIDTQIDKFNLKWEKVKSKMQNTYDREANILKAEEKTLKAEACIKELSTLLKHSIHVNCTVNWEELKSMNPFTEEAPENLLQSRLDELREPLQPKEILIPQAPDQNDVDFQPNFNFLEKHVKFLQKKKNEKSIMDFKVAHSTWAAEKARINDLNSKNKEQYIKDINKYKSEVEKIKNEYNTKFEEWKKRKKEFHENQSAFNERINQIKEKYLNGEVQAIIENCNIVLNNSKYPDYILTTHEVDYKPQSKLLIIDFCLPENNSLPRVKSVKYLKTKNEFKDVALSDAAYHRLYSEVIFQIVIRTIHEAFASDIIGAIADICFNGYVTDNERRKYIVSVIANKESFNKLDLNEIDCKKTIKSFKGKFRAKLEEVEPLLKIKTA